MKSIESRRKRESEEDEEEETVCAREWKLMLKFEGMSKQNEAATASSSYGPSYVCGLYAI